jgi:hypothetical protein
MKLRVGLFLMIGLVVLLSSCNAPTPSVISTSTIAPTIMVPTFTAAPMVTTVPTATLAPQISTPTAAAATATTAAVQSAKNATVTLTWYGHASFALSTGTGLRALLDPTDPSTGYKIPKMTNMDLVTASHEHSDHNATDLADGNPIIVLRGLGLDGWAKIDQTIKGVRVRTVGVFHDDAQGAQRGKNAIFICNCSGIKSPVH